jgi:hypothetical protein
MDLVGILYNPLSSPTVELAAEIDTWLQSKGVRTWRGASQDARADPAPLTNCSLLICMGGDGTVIILRSTRSSSAAVRWRAPWWWKSRSTGCR